MGQGISLPLDCQSYNRRLRVVGLPAATGHLPITAPGRRQWEYIPLRVSTHLCFC